MPARMILGQKPQSRRENRAGLVVLCFRTSGLGTISHDAPLAGASLR